MFAPMITPPRILRALVDDLPGHRPTLTPRQQDREAAILHVAEVLMARFGRAKLTMTNFALALRMSRATIRFHFVDLDCILSEILLRHLRAIAGAIGAVPLDAPDLFAARRAAYLAATRTFGAAKPAHRLLVRDRHILPPDLLQTVEQMRDIVAESVGGTQGAMVLALLDMEEFQAAQIEAMVAALGAPAPAPKATEPAARPPSPPIRFFRSDQAPALSGQPIHLRHPPKRNPPRAGPH
jgi:AcrR family transcriptional regulator